MHAAACAFLFPLFHLRRRLIPSLFLRLLRLFTHSGHAGGQLGVQRARLFCRGVGRVGQAHGLELISSLPPSLPQQTACSCSYGELRGQGTSLEEKAQSTTSRLHFALSAILNIQYVSPWWQWTRNVMESAVFVLIRKEGYGLDRHEEVYGISVTEDTGNTV